MLASAMLVSKEPATHTHTLKHTHTHTHIHTHTHTYTHIHTSTLTCIYHSDSYKYHRFDDIINYTRIT